MDFEMRPATPADEEWLFRLHDAAHRALVEAAYGPWIEDQQRDFFRALIDGYDASVIVVDGTDVGAVYLGARGGGTWLELIEVAPNRQGEGLGTAALRWVVAQSGLRGRATLLQVHRINRRAEQLYRREGFVDVEETRTHHLLRHP